MALTAAGAAYCWGLNHSGELGNGSTDSSYVPAAVSGNVTLTAIQSGFAHTCAIASGGTAYCWGDDYYGQLGRGVFGFSTVPIAVQP